MLKCALQVTWVPRTRRGEGVGLPRPLGGRVTYWGAPEPVVGFHGPRRSRLGAGLRAPSLWPRLTRPDDSPHPGATRVTSVEQRTPDLPGRPGEFKGLRVRSPR